MSLTKLPGQGRDDRAADRDDAADRRDEITGARDGDAEQRDIDADRRDDDARIAADELADHIHKISLQVLDRLARIESTTIDQADWPDLTPAAFARLAAYTAEQRRLAGLDRAAVYALLDDLHDAVGDLRGNNRAASRDRQHSLGDRHHSAGDRRDGSHDRTDARADRHQAAIDRERVDPRDLPPVASQPVEDRHPPAPRDLTGRAAQAITTSRRRISEARNYLARITRRPTPHVGNAPERPPGPGS